MLNSDQNDEECDATKVHSSNLADYIKTKFTFSILSTYEEAFNLSSSASGGDGGLIILKRHKHLKSRNIYVKELFVIEIFHLVGAMHFSHFSSQITTTYILIFFAGR